MPILSSQIPNKGTTRHLSLAMAPMAAIESLAYVDVSAGWEWILTKIDKLPNQELSRII